jgi:hypothetical protein
MTRVAGLAAVGDGVDHRAVLAFGSAPAGCQSYSVTQCWTRAWILVGRGSGCPATGVGLLGEQHSGNEYSSATR